MQKTPSKLTDVSAPQSVTDFIKIQTGTEAIKIGFTDQKVSAHGGVSALASFLHHLGFKSVLASALPARTSPNATAPEDLSLGFMTGILSGAQSLAQVAHLRRDPLLPQLLDIECIGSQSAYSRFFKGFAGAQQNSTCFGALWRWCAQQLGSRRDGYTLDLDSTCLLHEEAHGKEGVRTGHTPHGQKRCYHPLLGMIAESQLVLGFWLRPGNVRSDNNAVAFTQEMLQRLPHYLRIGLVRADSGFFEEKWLQYLEQQKLDYIVVGRMVDPMRNLIRRTTCWQKTDLAGTEIAELSYQGYSWGRERRVILIRHEVAHRPDAGGRELFELPGYRYQMLVSSLPQWRLSGLELWRRYNGRADCENTIKELDVHFALPKIALQKFYATEAALSLAVLSYNLCVLFQKRLGWAQRVKAATLRFRIFTTGAVISRTGGYRTVRLSVPRGPLRDWWTRLLNKIVLPFSNGIAVEPIPPLPLFQHRYPHEIIAPPTA